MSVDQHMEVLNVFLSLIRSLPCHKRLCRHFILNVKVRLKTFIVQRCSGDLMFYVVTLLVGQIKNPMFVGHRYHFEKMQTNLVYFS